MQGFVYKVLFKERINDKWLCYRTKVMLPVFMVFLSFR